MQDEWKPGLQDQKLVRPKGLTRVIDSVVLDDDPTSYTSDSILSGAFRRFALFLSVLSTSTPTTVQFTVEFYEPNEGRWHKYSEGVFASLYYEDTVTTTRQDDVYVGYVCSRAMRVKAVGTGTDSSKKFTISASVDFFN